MQDVGDRRIESVRFEKVSGGGLHRGRRGWRPGPGRQAGGRYDHEVATLEDLEARVAALEASQADYRAVLAAVNALLSGR